MRPVYDDRFGNPDKSACVTSAAHAHVATDGAVWQTIAFDTPMNAFPAEFYCRVTNLKEVTLVVEAEASA